MALVEPQLASFRIQIIWHQFELCIQYYNMADLIIPSKFQFFNSRIDPISEKLSYLSLKNEDFDLIDNQRNWWNFKIQKLKHNKLRFRGGDGNLQRLTIFEAFPEWKITFEYLETQATTEDLKTFYNLAKPFFSPSKFYANDIKTCPFTSALRKKKSSQFLDFLLELNTAPLYSKRLAKQVLIYGTFDTVKRFFVKTTQNIKSQDGAVWFQFACYAKDFRMFQFMFEIVGKHVKNGQNLFHHACHNKDPRFIQFVIEKLGRNGLNDSDSKGNTPLRYACKYGSKDTVEYLFRNKEDLALNINEPGWTLLHSACAEGPKEVVQYLLSYAQNCGIDVNATDHQWPTPYQIACSRGDREIIELFND